MVNCVYNHVAVEVDDVEAATAFYVDIFDLDQVETPGFSRPMAWFEIGEQQLQIIEGEAQPSRFTHFAVVVDDFAEVFDRVVARGLLESTRLRAFPSGVVRMYIHDPSENMVEIMWPDRESLPGRITSHIVEEEDNLQLEDGETINLAPNIDYFEE